jgi:uncharacterized protein YkwD
VKALLTPFLACALALTLCSSALGACGPAADRDPGAPGVSIRDARKATLCLLNHERTRDGLHPLRFNHKLALAGLRHARDMVQNDYFAHTAPSGQNFVARILRTDYVPPAASWILGENLAWGDHEDSTPRAIVRAWMASPAHRRNILTPDFREVGIAIVSGAPVPGVDDAATYATEFGVVHRA